MTKTQAVKLLIMEVSGKPGEINEDTNLFMSGYLDSFLIVNLIVVFEEKFNIAFDFQDVNEENFKNIEAIVNLLEKKYKVSIEGD